MMLSTESLLVQLTTQLGDWAAEADMTITQESDAVVVADPGGEIRFYVRVAGPELTISRAERAEDEGLQVIVGQAEDAVRFLTVRLGWTVRVRRGLRIRDVSMPRQLRDIAPGASLEKVSRTTDSGEAVVALVLGGSARAFFPDDPEPWRAVEFSHYANAPVDLIRQSFFDPRGAPLFTARRSKTSVRPRDEFFSREDRYSLGIDLASGKRYASFPVSIGVADYEEYYELTELEYSEFLADPAAAVRFVEECRRREHDELLLQTPGWNRGTPV